MRRVPDQGRGLKQQMARTYGTVYGTAPGEVYAAWSAMANMHKNGPGYLWHTGYRNALHIVTMFVTGVLMVNSEFAASLLGFLWIPTRYKALDVGSERISPVIGKADL